MGGEHYLGGSEDDPEVYAIGIFTAWYLLHATAARRLDTGREFFITAMKPVVW